MDRAQESSKQLRINNTISSCIKQALTGRLFFLAVAGIVFALAIGGFADFWKAAGDYREGLIAYGTHLKVLQNAIKSDALCLFLPVFAALPYTSAFLEEIDSGFIKSYLPRAGRWHYISAKILAAAISAGAACTLGTGVYYNLLRLIMLPMEKQGTAEKTDATYVLFFCIGMVFSLIGMLFSILTSSRYMAYASPFVLEYTLIILHERYLKKLYIIDPKEWLCPSAGNWEFGEAGAVIFLVLVSMLITVLLIPAMERRLDGI